MRGIFPAALLITLNGHQQPWSEESPDVLHLTAENFDTVLAQQESALVFMYAPWCGELRAHE